MQNRNTFSVSSTVQFVSFAWLLISGRLNTVYAQSCEDPLPNNNFDIPEIIPPAYLPCSTNFALIAGAASTSTTKWMLGEFHSRRADTVACIEELTVDKPRHQIYSESYEAGKEISCAVLGIKVKKGRTCLGWDDVKTESKVSKIFLNANLEINVADLEKFYTQQKFTDAVMDKYLNLLNTNNADEFIALKKASHILLQKRKSGLTYKKIFAEKNEFVATELTQAEVIELKKLNLKRLKFLTNILNKTPGDSFSIFVTGKSHVEKAEDEDTGVSEYVNQELKRGRHQNHFAVLAMSPR